MATTEPMNIPSDDEFPYFVIEIVNGRREAHTGPHFSFEEALSNIKSSPPGQYAITEHGRIIWPQSAEMPYS
jgi:hypothetical protein